MKKSSILIGFGLLLLTTVFIVVGGKVAEQDKSIRSDQLEINSDLQFANEEDLEARKQFIRAQNLDKALIENPDAILIDVRTPAELDESGYIEGMIHIPLQSMEAAEMEQYKSGIQKNDKIYIYCRSGVRSEKAMEKLLEAGYTDVTSVDGGYAAYSQYRK